jgi:hypothetical protein
MRNATRCFGWLLCLCAILLTAGCGGKGAVSGKVLYQGKPVPAGTVSFVLEGGGVVSSLIGEDGSYTIQNVPSGTVKITVETASARPPSAQEGRGPKAPKAPEFMMKYSKEKDPKAAERGKRYVPIPEQYSDPARSNLTYVVKSGKQEHDIDMK